MAMQIEREGVVRDEKTGELIIPASQRPDGTWRKARRVRDGYIPQEEVPVFESKGTQFLKSLPTHPIGLAPEDVARNERARQASSNPEPEVAQQAHTSKAAKKNAKRKEKKKQEKSATGGGGGGVSQVTDALNQVTLSSSSSTSSTTPARDPSGQQQQKAAAATTTTTTTTTQEKSDLAKKLKNLTKKLKQIEDLERRIQSGELANPEKDQLEKVAKKASIMEEIEDLQLELDDSS